MISPETETKPFNFSIIRIRRRRGRRRFEVVLPEAFQEKPFEKPGIGLDLK